MTDGERRVIGEDGQVTIPNELRERFSLSSGDEVVIREEFGKLVIEPSVTWEDFSEGYRTRCQREVQLAQELEGISLEANAYLEDAPDWD